MATPNTSNFGRDITNTGTNKAATSSSPASSSSASSSRRPPSSCSSRAPSSLLASISCALLLASLASRGARAWGGDGGGWRTGRATFYGYDGGATIHQGSCMYGSLPNGMVSTGKNIAALSDTDSEFSGSCGRCYEVQCNPAAFSDGYGNRLDRNGACYGGGRSVIVTITDSCPCNYPNNAYSNKRWCCGDMNHMDLSQEAYSQLSDTHHGVMGIKYRRVECPGGLKPSPRKATWDYKQGTHW